MRRYLSLVAICFLLVGCHQPKTTEYFLLHPTEIKSVMEQCNVQTDNKTPECIAVTQAANVVAQRLLDFEQNGAAYGLQILDIQEQLASAKNSLRTLKMLQLNGNKKPQIKFAVVNAEIDQITQKISQLELQQNELLAVIRLRGI